MSKCPTTGVPPRFCTCIECGQMNTTSRPVVNSPADEAEARDRDQRLHGQRTSTPRAEDETGMSSRPEARPVTATAHEIRRRHPFAVACRGCGAPIVWFRTKNGKRMPVDEETTQPTDAEHQLDLSRHRSHWATCPDAEKFRKVKP